MKGIAEIEFIISVFVFITSISFVTVLLINNIPLFHNSAFTEGLKSKSWQFSEMLLFDQGYPKDWQTKQFNEVRRIGFSSGSRYFIDQNKLSGMNAFCLDPNTGYNGIKQLLGLDYRNDITIEASYLDDSPVLAAKKVCGPAVQTESRPQFQITRLGILDANDMPIIRLKITIT